MKLKKKGNTQKNLNLGPKLLAGNGVPALKNNLMPRQVNNDKKFEKLPELSSSAKRSTRCDKNIGFEPRAER